MVIIVYKFTNIYIYIKGIQNAFSVDNSYLSRCAIHLSVPQHTGISGWSRGVKNNFSPIVNLQLRLHEASPLRKGQAKKLLKFTSQDGKEIFARFNAGYKQAREKELYCKNQQPESKG